MTPHGSFFDPASWYGSMQKHDYVSPLESLKSCGTFRVLVGVTGSVAALKLPLLVSQLLQLHEVSCFVFKFFFGCLVY